MYNKEPLVFFKLPLYIALWPQVTVIPDINKIAVLSNSKTHGSKICIPINGHQQFIEKDGEIAEWKYD